MLTRLDIKRFRGINEFSLTDAGRVNLIIGRNDTGKTSILEAIRLLLSGNPGYLRRTSRNRIERRATDLAQDYQLAFYQAQTDNPLLIEGSVNGILLSAQAEIREIQGTLSLPFDTDGNGDTSDDVDADDTESLLQPVREIVVEVTAADLVKMIARRPLQGRSGLGEQSRQSTGGSFPNVPQPVWLGTNRAEVWLHARRYSDLYRSGGADILINILKVIEPRLRSLVVLTSKESRTVFSTAVLEADLGFDKTLPLDSMGDGFGNIISIVSAVGGGQKGLCLMDEVDNGIHYSLLTQVWQSVLAAVNLYDTQVWATTHSYDCISSIYEAFYDDPDALRVHRLERRADGEVIVHTFDHEMLGRAIESGLEVR